MTDACMLQTINLKNHILGVEGEREIQEGGEIGTPMADSCLCMAETNTIL